MDEWVKMMWYIYTMEYYSLIKNNELMSSTTTWMDLEIITLCKVSQTKTNIIWYHLYVESFKKLQINSLEKQKQTHRYRKQIYGYQREKESSNKLGVCD